MSFEHKDYYILCNPHENDINYCDYIVGLDVHNIKNEETLLQFKQRIIKLLKEEFPNKDIKVEDIKCYVDGGYEG